MSLLRYLGGVHDEEMLCAAVLHDTVEECGISFAEIEVRFGTRVAFLVRGMTREEPSQDVADGLTKEELWQLRSEMLLEEIRRMDPEVWPIKLADRLSNLREAAYAKTDKKLDRYRKQTLAILEIIPKSANPPLWKAIAALVKDI
jgi:(p)ppGpp synthase/HD superfamily hydrolase